MDYMFCAMHSITCLNLTNFKTNNVKNMKFMFTNSENLTNIDLNSFDTSKVVNFQAMFLGLTKIQKLDLTSFDFSNGEIFTQIFYNCHNLSIWINEKEQNNQKFIDEIPSDFEINYVPIVLFE